MDLNPLNQINPVVIIATIIIFTATYIVLRRLFVLPYVEVMEAREQHLAEADTLRAEAQSRSEGARREAAEIVAEARQKAEHVIATATEEAEAERDAELAEVAREVSVKLEAGRAQIAEARANELSQLRAQAVECVGLACSRLFGTTDETTVEASVDHLMARRVQ